MRSSSLNVVCSALDMDRVPQSITKHLVLVKVAVS